jgi:HK97 family phage portal protein
MTAPWLTNLLTRAADWLRRLSADTRRPPIPLTAGPYGGPHLGFHDQRSRFRHASPHELLAELRNTAWACATINAGVCASFPPRLYVATRPGDAMPQWPTRTISVHELKTLRKLPHLTPALKAAQHLHEVVDHPLLDLLRSVNPVHNAFDLWELTTLYQEVIGCAYWLLDLDPVLGTPRAIWPLPSQFVTPRRNPDSPQLVDSYVYRVAGQEVELSPTSVIAFRYPDPREPYTNGLSPMRACVDQVRLASALGAFKTARFDNHALPDALVCPDQVIGEEERDRLETSWNARLRHGGAGRVIVAESNMRVQLLSQSMGDLAALADLKATREEIASAFHVPISLLTSETNLANLQAAEAQHGRIAIRPRLQRRDEKLNEQLVPLYDPRGRLFLAADDPVPANQDQVLRDNQAYLQSGVLTVNEVRSQLGLPPVAWGDGPIPASGNWPTV